MAIFVRQKVLFSISFKEWVRPLIRDHTKPVSGLLLGLNVKYKAESDQQLIDLLLLKIGGSKNNIKKKISLENIYIDGVLNREHNPLVLKGSLVEIGQYNRIPRENIQILFEDRYFIAIEKPTGILSSKSLNDMDHTAFGKVNKYLRMKSKGKERAYIVHRLDQHVSGLILFAKSIEVKEFFAKHWYDFQKTYHAIVQGCPSEKKGTIQNWLHEDAKFKVFSGIERPNSKLAITHYQLEQKYRNYSFLSVQLGTGRKNQIRVHLSDLGCPIVGDTKYGAIANPLGRIGLHAHSIRLVHPVSHASQTILSPTPSEFFKFI